MQRKKPFCFIIILVNICVYSILNFAKNTLDLAFFLSYEFAFFIGLCIIILSFLSYQKNILKKAEIYKFEKKPLFITLKKARALKNSKFRLINDDFKPSFKLALKNFGVFFSLAKLGAYVFLALGFLALQRHGLLDIFAFLFGISSLVLALFVFMFFVNLKERKDDKFKKNH